MSEDRSCGILLHITSLPSKYGLGDLGPEAYNFVDFLVKSKIKHWQILPLNPTSSHAGNSPYSSDSTFAGNILLISPELLAKERLIKTNKISKLLYDNNHVHALEYKTRILDEAYFNFKRDPAQIVLLNQFKKEQDYWLTQYALYKLLKSNFNNKIWSSWPDEFKNRNKETIRKFIQDNREQLEVIKFHQYIFCRQWFNLKAYCNRRNISIIGDIPYYVSHDSADVWSFPEYFKLDKNKNPAFAGGVPPDYFSDAGQLWGNPVYNWDVLMKNDFDWWQKRIYHALKFTDILRLDHFRAFSAYWEVDTKEKTAVNGNWIEVPGEEFFIKLKLKNKTAIIAEDLGDIDEGVRSLINKFGFPGMKVLQFAFDSKIKESPDALHRHIKNCVVYTGTHDNTTTRAWYEKAGDEDKQKITNYAGRKINEKFVSDYFIRLAMMSVANLCVIPMQDFLNLGDEATMNRPGTVKGNWIWQMKHNQLKPELQAYISSLVKIYARD